MELTTCSRCKKSKDISYFDRDSSKKAGIKMPCKACRSEYNKENYIKLLSQVKPNLKELFCYTCNTSKPSTEFHSQKSSKTGYNSNCRKCVSNYNRALRNKYPERYKEHCRKSSRKRREQHAQFLEEYKSNKPCVDCGKIFPPCCMDFDHISGEKEFDISANNTAGPQVLLAEIAKCELVCANCHRIRTKLRLLLDKAI